MRHVLFLLAVLLPSPGAAEARAGVTSPGERPAAAGIHRDVLATRNPDHLPAAASRPGDLVPRAWSPWDPVAAHVEHRIQADLTALEAHRPGYPFWSHIFSIPDGSVAFGSARDGRLLVTFPTRGDWHRDGRWEDGTLRWLLGDADLPSRLDDRREEVARILEAAVGPVVHNPTRADFLTPNARRYGGFLAEWGRIYERFGVPAELGLAQAIIESGLSGTIKSEARAIGFCQWLPRNWKRLQQLASPVIEVENQTTQAAYCAAHLQVLATKYGSFIPALSEHHAGVANVGRTVINGGRLGASDVRERYLVGGRLARDLRTLSPRTFSDVVGTYGPRSFLYAEMVFGIMSTVSALKEATDQEDIHAVRVPRAVPLDEAARRSGLTVEEIRRFNPALVRQVPKGATLYLPSMVEDLGTDATFWHRDAPEGFTEVLADFIRLDVTLEEWEAPGFAPVLEDFRRRFRETGSEEGHVMDAVLGYVMEEIPLSRRILDDFRTDPRVERLFEEGVRLRDEAEAQAQTASRQR